CRADHQRHEGRHGEEKAERVAGGGHGDGQVFGSSGPVSSKTATPPASTTWRAAGSSFVHAVAGGIGSVAMPGAVTTYRKRPLVTACRHSRHVAITEKAPWAPRWPTNRTRLERSRP